MSGVRYFDNHTHSYFSDDSRMDMDDAIRNAMEKGLRGIVFTDHMDLDPPVGMQGFSFEPEPQQAAIDMEVEYFGLNGAKTDFLLLKGIEIGLQEKSFPELRRILSTFKFDCVIGSLHLIDGKDPYVGDYYDPYDYRRAYRHYLEEFYSLMCKMPDFDILGHYDYIVRYASYPEVCISYSEFGDVLDPIFKFLVDNGKTMEINTKTYQLYRGRIPFMDIEVLRRFRELGGEAVSFGSDAHNIARIGENFDWCREMALAAGLKYEVYFRDRQPRFINL